LLGNRVALVTSLASRPFPAGSELPVRRYLVRTEPAPAVTP
jgi:hypothetical protein